MKNSYDSFESLQKELGDLQKRIHNLGLFILEKIDTENTVENYEKLKNPKRRIRQKELNH